MINQIHSFDNLHVIGDRVLIKPLSESERTDSGLILPPGVREKEKIQHNHSSRGQYNKITPALL